MKNLNLSGLYVTLIIVGHSVIKACKSKYQVAFWQVIAASLKTVFLSAGSGIKRRQAETESHHL